MTHGRKNIKCTFFVIFRSVPLRMKNVSDRSCTENQNTHFMFNNISKNRAVYEIMWKDVERGSPQMHTGYLELQIHSLNM